MMAMPAAGGAGLAAYLWEEAAGIDAPDPWESDSFDEAVYLEYAKRLARVKAAGVEDIDHDLLWGKASDDVIAAIMRADAQHIPGVEYRRDTAPELAELLKIDLAAPPQLQDLKNLLSGLASDGEQPEGKRRYRTSGERKTMGSLELVFSADKSVSVYAQGENRAAIVKAQRNAVDTAMQQIAGQLSFLRVRREGVDHRDPADLTWVLWQHRFNRLGQPQIHTHVSILNVVRSRTEDKVGTLDTMSLNGFYPTVRETYQRALANELGKLGLPVKFDERVPAAVLTNVPLEEKLAASSRTVLAEKAAAEYVQTMHGVDLASLPPKQRSAWVGRAAWHTRPRTKHAAQPDRSARQHDARQGKAIRPNLDTRYNRGTGFYDEKHGRSL